MRFFPLRIAHIALFYTINFFSDSPKGFCVIIGPVRSLAQPCSVNSTFFSLWEGQKWGFFPNDRTYRAFLHNKLFFLIAPRDLRYYWASAQPCSVNNTFFSLWEGQKWGFFPKERTYRAFLHNKLFFLIAPRHLRYYWASAQPCAALLSQQHLFKPLGRPKMGFFP